VRSNKCYTVLSRNRKGHKLEVQHPGTLSPVVGINSHFLGIILRRAAIQKPISCAKGIELANSLIEGTALQLCRMEWKKKHLKMGEMYDSFGFLGTHYWQNFFQRNHDIISAKKFVRFDSKRDDWCRCDNFSEMYDGVYGRLHETRIAEKLSGAVWRDEDNKFVTEADINDRKAAYSLLPRQAQNIIMVDEVGENISQKGDGNAGGHQFMVAANMRAQVQNSFKDNHFTVLGFTAATGGGG
jgi:hypothetical protein